MGDPVISCESVVQDGITVVHQLTAAADNFSIYCQVLLNKSLEKVWFHVF